MKTRLKTIILWIAKKRVLDGYIGVMGVVLFYKILADYGGWVNVIDLSARAWKWTLFSFDVNYHPINKTNVSYTFYPPFTARVVIAERTLLDTGAEAAKLTHERVQKWMDRARNAKAEGT